MCDFQSTATIDQTPAESPHTPKQVKSPKRFEILCVEELMNWFPLLKPSSKTVCANIELLTVDALFVFPVLHFESREVIFDVKMVVRKI